MRSTSLCLLLALSVSAGGTAASAGTVVAMSLSEMTDHADAIFLGRVSGIRADWNSERTRIYTYVTLEVDRYLKGGSGSGVETLRLLGGQVGPYLAMVPGTPQFVQGEEVLLFSAGRGARIPTVLGLSMGKFTVVRDGSGEAMVRRDISSLMVADHRTDSRKPGDPVSRYRLEDIESKIREALQ